MVCSGTPSLPESFFKGITGIGSQNIIQAFVVGTMVFIEFIIGLLPCGALEAVVPGSIVAKDVFNPVSTVCIFAGWESYNLPVVVLRSALRTVSYAGRACAHPSPCKPGHIVHIIPVAGIGN